jgi:hypothetical protein
VARCGRLDSSNSSGMHSYACSLVHSELSWWGLKSSLHLHVAHIHYGSRQGYFIEILKRDQTGLANCDVVINTCDCLQLWPAGQQPGAQ